MVINGYMIPQMVKTFFNSHVFFSNVEGRTFDGLNIFCGTQLPTLVIRHNR